MGARDLISHVLVAISLLPAARTASADGSTVDTQGYDSAFFEIIVGARTNGAFVFGGEESDDNVNWTAIAASDLTTTFPTVDGSDDASQIYRVGYKGSKRYLRAIVDEGSSPAPGTGAVFGVNVVLGHPRLGPVA